MCHLLIAAARRPRHILTSPSRSPHIVLTGRDSVEGTCPLNDRPVSARGGHYACNTRIVEGLEREPVIQAVLRRSRKLIDEALDGLSASSATAASSSWMDGTL